MTAPLADTDSRDAHAVVVLLRRVAAQNLEDANRTGSTVHLRDPARVTVLGDLHDHTLNLQRGSSLAGLEEGTGCHLMLQEVIHGPSRINGRDLSIRTLIRVADLLDRHPGRVHVLLSNHELAQARGESILKDGDDCVDAFTAGLEMLYADCAENVAEALADYVHSLPLAVRIGEAILCTHSLPSPRDIDRFDPRLLDRLPTEEDLSPRGSAHMLVWGRHINARVADELAEAWEAEVFVCGHQPAPDGWETQNHRTLILAADHNHAQAAVLEPPFDHEVDGIIDCLVPLAGVVP